MGRTTRPGRTRRLQTWWDMTGFDPDRIPSRTIRNAYNILEDPLQIRKISDNVWNVAGERTRKTRFKVQYWAKAWHCACLTGKPHLPNPCSHILAVLIQEGHWQEPVPAIAYKRDSRRDYALIEQAQKLKWRMAPEILSNLVAPLPDPINIGPGRPCATPANLAFQAIARVLNGRSSLRALQGRLSQGQLQKHAPGPPVSRSSISRFLCAHPTAQLLDDLLLLSASPAAGFDDILAVDGTGFSTSMFTPYFDEKHHTKGNRRQHEWMMAVLPVTYNYNIVPAAAIGRGLYMPESPTLLPLLDRVRRIFDVKEVQADGAYPSRKHAEYMEDHDIRFDTRLKSNATGAVGGGFGRLVREYQRRPAEHQRRYGRRNNCESVNRSIKWLIDDRVYSKHPVAQANEVRCMLIAYNITRLVYLHLKENLDIDFRPFARRIMEANI